MRLISHRLNRPIPRLDSSIARMPRLTVRSALALMASDCSWPRAWSSVTRALICSLAARSMPFTALSPATGSAPAAMKASRPLR
ncbi:hypothetical protein D3C80_1954990 [compost metagenome]